MHSRQTTRVGAVVVVVTALAAIGGAVPAADAGTRDCDSRCKAELERARIATEKYRDVGTATRDGFVESSACRSSAAGTLGIRYTSLASLDQTVEAENPESLLYVPEGVNGAGRRLLAVEYSVPVLRHGLPYHGTEPPDASGVQKPPELFGRQFSGPAPGQSPAEPWHYYLHAWVFSANPAGLLADANPVEACDATTLRADYGSAEGCHEVFGIIPASAERVRDAGGIPAEFRLRGEANGAAQLMVSTFSCESVAVDGTEAPTKFAEVVALLDPPDWAGDDPCCSRYLFGVITDNPDHAKWERQGTGLGSDVIAYSRDGLRLRFEPLVGMTGPNYEFTAPDFTIRATAADPVPREIPTSVRWWAGGPREMAQRHFWAPIRLGAAGVEVTPQPGSLLAEMVGCDAEPGSGACAQIAADSGFVVTWDFGALTLSAR